MGCDPSMPYSRRMARHSAACSAARSQLPARHSTIAANHSASSWTRSSFRASLASHGPRTLRASRSEEHTSELQSRRDLVCRLLLEKKKKSKQRNKQEYKENHQYTQNNHTHKHQ